jgi:List-Bact-rpt repeat protein/beta-propeller repeat-containing protein
MFLPMSATPASATTPGPLLVKTWGGPHTDIPNAVAIDSARNVYVAGQTNSFGAGSQKYGHASLLKYNAAGALLWQRVWGGRGNDTAWGVAVDGSGNVYVTGATNSTQRKGQCYSTFITGSVARGAFPGGNCGLFLLKYDSTGTLKWQKTWVGSTDSEGRAVTTDPAGNIYVAGLDCGSPNTQACIDIVLKFDSSGNLSNTVRFAWGAGFMDLAEGIALDSSGNIYITGGTDNKTVWINTPVFYSQLSVAKFSSAGVLQWGKIWGHGSTTSEGDWGNALAVDGSGNVYVAGNTHSVGTPYTAVVVLKFDTSGNYLGLATWGGAVQDRAWSIALDSSNNIYVTGQDDISVPRNFLLEMGSNPGPLISQIIWGGSSGVDSGNAIAVDGSGTVYAAAALGEAPPYTFTSASGSLSNPTVTLIANTNATAPIFNATMINPGGTVVIPSGSETYTGAFDSGLLFYGTMPLMTFSTSISGSIIVFNGTSYLNGQSTLAFGTSSGTAVPPSGYVFSSWSTSGNVTVSNPTSNPTTVYVSGPGNLKANFTPIGAPLPANLAMLTGILVLPVILMRKRRHS